MADIGKYEIDFADCPKCDQLRGKGEFEFVGFIAELGNLPRLRCLVCSHEWEELISIAPQQDFEPDEEGNDG